MPKRRYIYGPTANSLGNRGESVMVFVKVASTKDLPPGRMLNVASGGNEILVVSLEGKYYAIAARFQH